MTSFETKTFATAGGLALTLDLHAPPLKVTKESIAFVHFHGGFFVLGGKQTFSPTWLTTACARRGWTYITPAYRLLPEASGRDMIADAVSAINWVADNVSSRIVLAGSSAGGFLAFAAAAQLRNIRPLAVLSVYGINDLTSDEYTQGTSIMGAPPLSNLDELIEELQAARASGAPICEYEFPEDLADKRMQWISAIHEAGLYPELMTGLKGISSKIAAEGVGSVPDEYRTFFPLDFFLGHNFPPTVLLHGDADSCVSVEQSKRAYEKLTESGVKAHLELVPGKDHGFDAMEVSVDTDHENPAEESPLFAHLRAVLDFIDQTVKKHN